MIQFLLDQQSVREHELAPNLSILDWLRTNRELTGTKEGCASGDCGACTVIIGELQQGRMHYRTANACLTLMASLHGKQLLTIEHLAGNSATEDTPLHPVQQAMIDCHGSQCGFCTPGFIMSLYALYLSYDSYPGREAVIEALGGNLCRCTGYRPILEAAEAAFNNYPRPQSPCAKSAETLQKLHTELQQELQQQTNCLIPTTLTELLALRKKQPLARLVAGATDLSLEYSQLLKPAEPLILLGQVAELLIYREDQQHIEIGAALPYSDFYPRLFREYPEAREVLLRLGSRQVRNLGTLGGSLGNASPIGDPAPLLLALDAQIRLCGPQGERQIAIADFFTGYRQTLCHTDEIIQSVLIPRRQPGQKLFFYKLSKRYEDDISTVCMALSLTLEGDLIAAARTGFGGMAATPATASHLQQALIGLPLTPEALQPATEQLVRDFQPMSDARASATYRLQAAANLVLRCAYEHQSSTSPVRVYHA